MYVKAPPRLGSSSATAAVITDAAKAAPRPAAHNPALNIIAFLREFSDRVGGSLLIEPDRRQILIEVMARADFPAFDIRSVRNHPVIPQQKDRVRLGIEHVFLEVADQRPLLRRVGLAQRLIVEVDRFGILEVSVICGVDRARQVPLHVERCIDHALAISSQHCFEIATAHCFEIWTCRHYALGDVDTDLAPLVDYPSGVVFIGLVDIAVQQLKAEPLGSGLLQETLRLSAGFLDVGRKSGDFLQLLLGRSERRAGKDDATNRMHVGDPGKPRRAMPPVDRQAQCAAHPGIVEWLFLWLGSMIPPQFQSLSWTVILSPSAPTSSSRTAGGKPRNSIAARSPRIASTRTACLSA